MLNSAEIDQFVAKTMSDQHIPGIALAICQNGEVAYSKGYGRARIESNTPVTPDTIFQIQSLTKQFVAVAIMILARDSKLCIDNSVGEYLNDLSAAWKPIALRRLLSHTSGIRDFINDPVASLRVEVTNDDIVLSLANEPLVFQPGEKYAYSNTNYHLIAMLIRKLTGKSYGEFLRERIFDVLGMHDTDVVDIEAINPRFAAGYQWKDDRQVKGDFIAQSILAYGGGGLTSTVLDLAKWDAALATESLLSREVLNEMWTPTRLNDGSISDYGLGWMTGDLDSHPLIEHSGSHYTGFTTFMTRLLDKHVAAIVLTNFYEANLGDLVHQLCSVA